MDPFTAFGPYMASTVLISQYEQSETPREDLEDLRLIMTALLSLQKHWKMTHSFIMQLNEDLKQHNIDISIPEQRGDEFQTNDDTAEMPQFKTGPLLVGVLQRNRPN